MGSEVKWFTVCLMARFCDEGDESLGYVKRKFCEVLKICCVYMYCI